jgi:2-desacetyl-2-hydroxyethyl bacteriochlorophyllide A dehydrogenase
MKAAVYHGAGDIRVEDVSAPILEADGILIRVKACGICGSDLHTYKGRGRTETGLIMGHEFSGDVAEVGANVSDIKKGDRVTAAGYKACGECYWCQSGQSHRCPTLRLVGYEFPGAFAEYVSIPVATVNRTVFPISDEISYEVGATIEPLSVGVNAARRAQPTTEDIVVVLGAGMIGQCSMQACRAMGASKLIVTEMSKKRLEVAKATGADVVINAAEEDPIQRVREATSGMGAGIVVECAGAPATFQQALAMVRGGGKVMLVGVYEEPIQWHPITVIQRNVSMIGCFAGSFPRAIDFLQTGKIDTKPLISHEFSLDEAPEAFETQLKADESVKVVIKP